MLDKLLEVLFSMSSINPLKRVGGKQLTKSGNIYNIGKWYNIIFY